MVLTSTEPQHLTNIDNMKNIITFLLTISLSGYSVCHAQFKVVSVYDLPAKHIFELYADADGKVLLSDDFNLSAFLSGPADSIQVFPGWPLYETGSSERGGIFCNLDADPESEVVYSIGQKVHAWNIDGSPVSNWPVNVQLYPDGAPAFGDIDGDGAGEVVVSTQSSGTANDGRLFAFHQDGSAVDGFPIVLNGGATKTPVLADLDGDGIMEIIIEERNHPNGYVGVYSGDGSAFPGWPATLDYIPGSAVAVGDITGDSVPEIIAESYYSIFAFDIAGNVLPGFPFTPGNDRVFSYSSPVLADLDMDGKREILAGDHSLPEGNGKVHALRYDGTSLPGWPKTTSYWIYGPPSVADIDSDGSPDVAIGDQVLSGSPVNKVYVWDSGGNNLPGWPVASLWSVNNQIIIADLDGDGMKELMWDDNTGGGDYHGYNHDGSVMEGWPLPVQGSTFFMNPFITDIDNDGILDISGGGTDFSTGCHIYLWNGGIEYQADNAELAVLQYNVRHDGVYQPPDVQVIAGFTADTTFVCEGDSVHFQDQSSGPVNSREWHFPGGEPDASTDQNPAVQYNTAGFYDVTLIVSGNGNQDTLIKEDYIEVVICTGKKEIEQQLQKLTFFPNPCKDEVFLVPQKDKEVSRVILRNIAGTGSYLFDLEKTSDELIRLDVGSVPSGVYLLETDNGTFGKLHIVR